MTVTRRLVEVSTADVADLLRDMPRPDSDPAGDEPWIARKTALLGTLAMSTNPIDAAVAILDARGEKWELYRCHDKDWIVNQDGNGPNARTARGSTIQDALTTAVASIPLPLVPRRPATYVGLEVVKSGTHWSARDSSGRTVMGWIKTKKQGLAHIVAWQERQALAQAQWDAAYAQAVADGTDGIDFRYVDRLPARGDLPARTPARIGCPHGHSHPSECEACRDDERAEDHERHKA